MKTRIKLKPLKLSDIDHIMTWVNNPEMVKNFQNFKGFTRQQELSFLKKLKASKNDFAFSIFKKTDNTYLGQCSINQISWQNKLGKFSIFITKENWGRGYAEEAIKLLVQFAFKKLRLHKVWGICWTTNKKAWRVYKKFGFKKEGVLKDEYFWRGKYHDLIRMAIVK